MNQIACSTARYIKFGSNGAWVEASLEQNELHFGFGKVPHELALGADHQQIAEFCRRGGREERRSSEIARQVVDFHSLGSDCLWITFARGFLWWTFAAPEVTWLGFSEDGKRGERIRKSIGGWKNVDINGKPLAANSLSTKLTQVMYYRQTICEVNQRDYLLRRINGVDNAIVSTATNRRNALVDAIAEAICELHWVDFETLVDILFSRSGWHRTSMVGGKQETIDLELEQITTGERIAVQVKSRANQKMLDSYIARTDLIGIYDRLFFVCHSPNGRLAAPDRADVHVWAGRELAERVVRVGLHDWVLEKVA